MNQLPQNMESLCLLETLSTPSSSTRVLRKRPLPPDSSEPTTSKKQRMCLEDPQDMAQIKKLYLNQTFKNPNVQNLETIFEEGSDDKQTNSQFGKQKIRRRILFKDGIVTKTKARHRKKMVRLLESLPGRNPRVKQTCLDISLDEILNQLAEEQDDSGTCG